MNDPADRLPFHIMIIIPNDLECKLFHKKGACMIDNAEMRQSGGFCLHKVA